MVLKPGTRTGTKAIDLKIAGGDRLTIEAGSGNAGTCRIGWISSIRR
jgi:hypothetical protein